MDLAAWLNTKKEFRATFAARVGVHPITVSKWCGGVWIPRAELLDRISDATGGEVTANDFAEAVRNRRQAAQALEAA